METFNIDTIIFVGFLIINIALGLASSRGIKTIKEYAIGNRNFSTATLVATLVATWIGGGFFVENIIENYEQGLYYIFTSLAQVICFLIIAWFFAPYLACCLNKLSIADFLGGLYGNKVRFITVISGFISICGIIAIQLKVAGSAFEYILNIPSIYGILAAGFVIILYSSLGGIKSVTFTDIIQFFTFGTIIPLLTYYIFTSFNDLDSIIHTLIHNQNYDLTKIFDSSNLKTWNYLFLFFYCLIPGFDPAIFQRIAMSSSYQQVSKSFYIVALACLFLTLSMIWLSIVLLSKNPDIPSNEIIKTFIYDSAPVGLKGLVLIGIMAMIMSTADSYINSSSILLTYDFCKSLGIRVKNELLTARIISVLIGIFAILLSLKDSSIFRLALYFLSFYMPIVTVPFIITILGYRTPSENAVLCGMAAGFFTTLLWSYCKITVIDSLVPAMLANLIVLISGHYLLKQQNEGWIDSRVSSVLIAIRQKRKEKTIKLWRELSNFNIGTVLRVCKYNCPKGEGLISILGLFVIISSFGSVNTLVKEVQMQFSQLLWYSYPVTLFTATVLITYPLWLQRWKDTDLLAISWNLTMFCILIVFNFLMVLVSNFSEMQLMIFMANIFLVSSLTRWWWALFAIASGVFISLFFYENYLVAHTVSNGVSSLQFKIIYLLILICSTVVIFLKPKQEQQELTEQIADHLSEQVHDIDEELKKSIEVKNEFLRNLEHEAHTPIVGITTMGQVLFENYDKLTEEQRRKGLKEISKSSERLSTLVNNMIDVSKLSSLNYVLNKTLINLSDLIYQRLDHCKKLYLENKDLEFICDIEDDLLVNCDEHYITSTLDNLIVNAITYSKDGEITIKFKKNNDLVKFKITDEGIGIPQKELYTIFGTFTVSSRTKTPAGGRGLGLALCKGAIEAHKGQIWCKSNGKKGSTFSFTLPIDDCSHFSNP